MLLKDLIKNLPEETKKIRVRGLSIDSKKIKQGFIFFAIKRKKNLTVKNILTKL